MIPLRFSSCLWILFYLLMATAPLIGGIFNLSHGRGFWTNFSAALGFVALSMFAAQFVLVSRIRAISEPVGMDGVIALHKYLAYAAAAFALVHPAILFTLDKKYWPLLNVFTSPLRAKFAVLATFALLLIIVLSIWRKPLKIRYPVWKATHWFLSILVVVGGLAHAALVNYYLKDPWEQLTWLALSVLFVLLGVWVRIIKPLLHYRRRWRIVDMYEAPTGVTNLTLGLVDPDAYGPAGFRFKPGQFSWIMAGRSPFALTYHPFSLTSSAEQTRQIAFSIKAFDGFSSDIANLRVGDNVYVDGPHGTFFMEDKSDSPIVLIAGGVGVTPLVSMLATLADRGSQRPCHLWLANRDSNQVACGVQIADLEKRLNLVVKHLFSQSETGPTGQRLDTTFIKSNLPDRFDEAVYYMCGPTALMDSAQATLIACGVPGHRIHSERFSMV